jgi:hypothetical protein
VRYTELAPDRFKNFGKIEEVGWMQQGIHVNACRSMTPQFTDNLLVGDHRLWLESILKTVVLR